MAISLGNKTLNSKLFFVARLDMLDVVLVHEYHPGMND